MNTEEKKSDALKYLRVNARDEEWGIVITTVGYQYVSPNHAYPLSKHPDNYNFKNEGKRTLNEYQLVYITRGEGYFSSRSCPKTHIEAGTMLLLFPGEWHKYYPDARTGWDEHWVGFRGSHIDNRVKSGFFTPSHCLFKIGTDDKIIDLYHEIMDKAEREKAGFQQIVSSIVLHLLGSVYYKDLNRSFNDDHMIDIINRARIMMKEEQTGNLSPETIAARLGVGYSLFRREFKRYSGISPGQYQQQLKLARAKELLSSSNLSIAEIAFELNFECVGQFSTFFRKKEGVTPSELRRQRF